MYKMTCSIAFALTLLSFGTVEAAPPATPSADEILRQATAILAPDSYEAQIEFTTHKPNGQVKSFAIQMWKKGSDTTRFKFLSPADDRDQEVLRIGDNMWNYMPNLKRSLRISPKQEFHGGDFSNSDMLRVDLVVDYTPVLLPAASPKEWLLELTAKNDQVAYHKIKFWVRKQDAMPLRQEFYTQAGKLVRKLELTEVKAFGKLLRPSKYLMQNLLVQSRSTEVVWTSLRVTKFADDTLFQTASLGH